LLIARSPAHAMKRGTGGEKKDFMEPGVQEVKRKRRNTGWKRGNVI